MREITFFWSTKQIMNTDVAPMLEIVERAEFLAYIKRTPNDVCMLMKTHFKPGKKPHDLNSLYFFELIDIFSSPDGENGSYILNVRLTHPLTNFNARTGGTTTVPGSRLSKEGVTYIVQGGSTRLRLLAAVAKLISKPERISARNLNNRKTTNDSPLSNKQLKLAKFAYDKGWYDPKIKVTISNMANELGIARATLSEQLSKIESIIMTDVLGSFADFDIGKENKIALAKIIEENGKRMNIENESFKELLAKIHSQIYEDDNELFFLNTHEGAKLGTWEENHKTGEMFWSSTVKDIFGIDKDIIENKDFWDNIHPDDFYSVKESWEKAKENNIPFDISFRIKLDNGEVKYIMEQTQFVIDENGDLSKSVGTIIEMEGNGLTEQISL